MFATILSWLLLALLWLFVLVLGAAIGLLRSKPSWNTVTLGATLWMASGAVLLAGSLGFWVASDGDSGSVLWSLVACSSSLSVGYWLGRSVQPIGLTGGIACGKSTVSQQLLEGGLVVVIDADKLAREVVEPGKPAYLDIVKAFGEDVVLADKGGVLDREKLGKLVFGDPKARRAVNRATHSRIAAALLRRLLWYSLCSRKTVVLDVPLLVESRLLRWLCAYIVSVSCGHHTQLQRLMGRNNLSSAEAEARIGSQMSSAARDALADFVVDNTGSLPDLQAQVDILRRTLAQHNIAV